MQNFRNLDVWERSHALTLRVYACTQAFPRDELYGLVSQMRRAAASISANIAEGCGRATNKDKSRFLHISSGSASETEYHLLLAHDLEYLKQAEYEMLQTEVTEIKKMLTMLLRRMKFSDNDKMPTTEN